MAKSTNSCGTPCSPSMTRPETPSAASPSVDGAALLRELEGLRTALEALAGNASEAARVPVQDGGATEAPALLLARVVAEVTPEDWQALVRNQPELAEWFALPLDPADTPNLAALTRRCAASKDAPGTGLVGEVICQQTGTLLANAFMAQLERQTRECLQRGSDLVVMLFDVLDEDPEALDVLASTLRALARGCDVPARIAERRMALLMPGTSALRARGFAERIMVAYVENRPPVFGRSVTDLPLKAGLACFDAETASDAARLLEQAAKALDLAKPGSTKTFRRGGEILDERKTQVQAREKQFLFFGTKE